MSQEQKIWVITGVSRGLGRALAEKAIANGDIVIGTARKTEHATEFTNLQAGKSFGEVVDIRRRDSIKEFIDKVVQQFKRIDVLVNNAGYGLVGAIEEASMQEIRDQMETNFFGAIAITQSVLPIMRAQRSGNILQISSASGFRSIPGFGIYNASKFALEGFSEALYYETAPLNIKVTIVEPGPFRTSFLDDSSKRTARIIEDYETVHITRSRLADANGKQEGDPAKAAAVMIQAVNSGNPPLRLVLGKAAIDSIRAKIDMVQKDIAAWEKNSLQTSFEN